MKTLKSFALYTLLSLCCFAILHSLFWWITQQFYWYEEMLLTEFGRGTLASLFLMGLGLSAAIFVAVTSAK
jgi:hypothetical protein